MSTIYSFGYSGKKPEQLKKIIDELDATLFDIRFSPRSRNPVWNRLKLIQLLGENRYHHVQAFGNRNYKGGPVELVDPFSGLVMVQGSDRPIVLLCMCPEYERCHRKSVVELITNELGYTHVQAEHLLKPQSIQRRLF